MYTDRKRHTELENKVEERKKRKKDGAKSWKGKRELEIEEKGEKRIKKIQDNNIEVCFYTCKTVERAKNDKNITFLETFP